MKWTLAIITLALLSVSIVPAPAAQKVSSSGVACNSTGTARKDGKDQDGNKMNCQWDTCTYCGTTQGVIDCSKQLTEYSNPTDCHAAASIFGGNGHQSVFSNGNLDMQQQLAAPETKKPKQTGGVTKKSP